MTKAMNVLVIDDERTVCEGVERVLARRGHSVQSAFSAVDALDAMEAVRGEERFDLLILDLMLPQMTGMELLEMARTRWPAIPVLIITGYASIPSAVRTTKLGAAGYLPKPFTPQELEEAVEKVMAGRW